MRQNSIFNSEDHNDFSSHFQKLLACGGRLTKWKGQTASCAPVMASPIIAGGDPSNVALSTSQISLAAALALSAMAAPNIALAADNISQKPTVFNIGGSSNAAKLMSGNLVVATSNLNALSTGPVTLATTAAALPQSGIYEYKASGDTTDIVISTDDAYGSINGIYAFNAGSGSTQITSTGTARGDSTYGIYAYNADGDIRIYANNAYGGTFGILTYNGGAGTTTITVTGDVEGAGLDGLYAFVNGGDLNIDANNVNGNSSGVYAINTGSGFVDITTRGEVNTINDHGIYASSAGSGIKITSYGDVSGGSSGIFADNVGTGSVMVTASGDVNASNGTGIVALNGYSGRDIDINFVDVTGSNIGVNAFNLGTGSISISSTGTVAGGTGIFAYNSFNGTNIDIDVGNVSGKRDGIIAQNYGSGVLSIMAGDINGGDTIFDDYGINAVNFGTNLIINVDNIDSGDFGIVAQNIGSGALSITSNGTVTGGQIGIYAGNAGDGDLTIISYDDVTGTYGDGIFARNFGDSAVTVNAVNVTGGRRGIFATNTANDVGGITVETTGTVLGLNGDGIDAFNYGAGAVIVSANNVSGNNYGIFAYNGRNGVGGVTVTTTGNVTGLNANGIVASNLGTGAVNVTANNVTGGNYGIFAYNSTSGSDLNITTMGNINGGSTGIGAISNGSGATEITSTGAVSGTAGDGVYSYNSAQGTNVMIDVVDVTGALDGITVRNSGTGHVSISSTGTVAGATGYGIDAFNSAAGTSLTIDVNDVTGNRDGINARNFGTGDLNIISTGNVTGITDHGINASNFGTGALNVMANNVSGGYYGIIAFNSVTSTGLSINTSGIIDGNTSGISAVNFGSGALEVTSTGNITGGTYDGLYSRNSIQGTNLIIDVVDVTGAGNGINAQNNGTGYVSISSTGTVTGNNGNGIDAYNSAAGTSLTIDVNNVMGDQDGIQATNYGNGDLKIDATGDIVGTYSDGIDVTQYGGGALIIQANNVTGGNYGIYAYNDTNGLGGISIITSGTVTGVNNDGIDAINLGAGSTDVTANNVSGGIFGIFAANSTNASDLNITAMGNINGGLAGIIALNYGSGALEITSTGNITGGTYDGIYSRNSIQGTNLIIDVVDVTGGITAQNNGTGYVSISSTGTVTGNNGNGIDAYNSAAGTSLTIDVNNVMGDQDGIQATNFGTGDLKVNSIGDITGTNDDGIDVVQNGGGALIIQANNVTGGNDGIYAYNDTNGLGGISITSTGTVTGLNDDGIYAINSGAAAIEIMANNVSGGSVGIFAANSIIGTDLIITTTGTIEGSDTGIIAGNAGSGELRIESTGAVTANSAIFGSTGIYAINSYRGTNLIINAVDADGIDAVNHGSGDLSITTTGNVTGTTGGGIQATNTGSGAVLIHANNVNAGGVGILAVNEIAGTGGINIETTGAVSGDYGAGIYAFNYGAGAINITANNVHSNRYNGISAYNSAAGTSLTIDVTDAAGSMSGVDAINLGSGVLTINIDGDIQGGTGAAVSARAGLSNISLNEGANVGRGGDVAIFNDNGDSDITLNIGSTVAGEIYLNGGSDTLNFAGGDFSGLTVIDGGGASLGGFTLTAATAEIDMLNFNLPGAAEIEAARLSNWEQLNINSGTLKFSDAAITINALNINSGGTLDGGNGTTITSTVGISANSYLFGGNTTGDNNLHIIGDVNNSGFISLAGAGGSSIAGDRATIDGNYVGSAGSRLVFDVALGTDGSASDLLTINGDASGTSAIIVNNVGGSGGITTGDGIQLLQVNGNNTGTFTLAGPVNIGAFGYTLALGSEANPNDGALFLQSNVRAIALPIITIARSSQEIGLAFLGTVNERIGEIRKNGIEAGGPSAIWGRVIGKKGSENLTSSAIGDLHSRSQFGGLQLGFDAYNFVSDSGAYTNIGGYVGYSWSNFDDYFRAQPRQYLGTTDSDGWLAGIYATHYRPSGLYINAVVQGLWLDHNARAIGGIQLDTDSEDYSASIEVGQSFAVNKTFKIEPQVQLIYGTTDVEDNIDNIGVEGELDIQDTLTGRIGFRLVHDYDKAKDKAGSVTTYVKANLWHRITGGAVTAFETASPVNVDPRKTWADVGLGAGIRLNDRMSLFADSDVEFGLDKQATSYTGKIGFRINW